MAKKNKRLVKGGDAHGKSWVPGQKGPGGEGMSDGYGGSTGFGTGASGPQHDEHLERDPPSRSLPSREKIAGVLR
jgi:hypothetical protein